VLNVADDHIGLDGVASLDDMARVKRLVADSATGTLVLNAEDPRCLAMAERCRAGRVVLFSLDPEHPAVATHVAGGGVAFVLEGNGAGARLTRRAGAEREALLEAAALPISFAGIARFNLANALAAMALAESLGVPRPAVCAALRSFEPAPGCNPGRTNRYTELPFEVVLDYAHNRHGLAQLLPVLKSFPARGRRICSFGVNGHSHDDRRAMA
jgi:cyanophycin synthetase